MPEAIITTADYKLFPSPRNRHREVQHRREVEGVCFFVVSRR